MGQIQGHRNSRFESAKFPRHPKNPEKYAVSKMDSFDMYAILYVTIELYWLQG